MLETENASRTWGPRSFCSRVFARSNRFRLERLAPASGARQTDRARPGRGDPRCGAQAVGKLIEAGADVNARDAEGNTPLILASFYASPRCVELLLEKGADPNAANRAGVTALIRAATDYEKTRLLVDAGAKVGVRTADLGNTPLILAARRAGNSRTVRLLLERGAGATERNNAGISPIMSGAASGDLETVRLLLDAGAKAGDFPRPNDPRAADARGGLSDAADVGRLQ